MSFDCIDCTLHSYHVQGGRITGFNTICGFDYLVICRDDIDFIHYNAMITQRFYESIFNMLYKYYGVKIM